MNQEQAKLFEKVLDYLWSDEEKDCQEKDDPKNHIFNTLLNIQKELDNFYMDTERGVNKK